MGGSAFTITFSLRPSERSPRSPRILFLISHIPRFNMPFIDLFEKWPPLISINLFSPDKQVNHIMRKSMSNLVVRLGFWAVGQTHAKWQAFEKPENKRQMYGSQVWVDRLPYICLLFSGFSNVCHFTCIWSRALKLGCITNVNMLFLTMGFVCLFYENKFMLISGGHISNRSMPFIPFIPFKPFLLLFWLPLFSPEFVSSPRVCAQLVPFHTHSNTWFPCTTTFVLPTH